MTDLVNPQHYKVHPSGVEAIEICRHCDFALGNAIKYAPGSAIEVRVGGNGGTGYVSVKDDGIGIAKADVERIFGQFERAVSVRHYGGVGLGLYIAQQIASAHGGRIHVESEQGHGSTFLVELPVLASVSEQRAPM